MAFIVPPARSLLTTGAAPNIVEEEETAADAPLVSKRHCKRANEESNVNTPRKVGDELPVSTPASQETPSDTMNLDPISFRSPHSSWSKKLPSKSSKGDTAAGGPESDPTSPTIVMSPGGIYQPEWGVTNSCRLDTPSSCQELVDHLAPPGYFLELRHLLNEELLGQFNMTLARQVAMGSQLRLWFEQEAKLLRKSIAQFTELQVSRNGLSHQVSTLQAQVTGEEKIKAAFEEFKKYEDERVRARCAEIDSRLDALSIDFDEELYPHMLTVIAGRRITKGFYDGLKYGVEQGEAKLDLAMVKGYDPEAEGKFIATMQALKDLKYPLIDELKKLKDAPMDLKIPVYPEVRDPQDPWAVKEEMLLEDVIAANVSRAEKKKKCRIVYRTHSVGSGHHARSDGVPLSMPTAVPQGLAILLADAETQTDVPEEESSPKLTRSKSMPSM
ncbi:hypothetical protein Tco_0030925 [Tanacetum coccineum]